MAPTPETAPARQASTSYGVRVTGTRLRRWRTRLTRVPLRARRLFSSLVSRDSTVFGGPVLRGAYPPPRGRTANMRNRGTCPVHTGACRFFSTTLPAVAAVLG